jgi:hypothetical protein
VDVSKNIELDRDELEELEAVLAQERHPELPAFERLQNEVHQTLREGGVSSGPDRIRTCDLGIKSPLLYQLSYRPAESA